MDPTYNQRRELQAQYNSSPRTKAQLEEIHGVGNVWTTEEATAKFRFISFLAPFVVTKDMVTGEETLLAFQHSPRLYWKA